MSQPSLLNPAADEHPLVTTTPYFAKDPDQWMTMAKKWVSDAFLVEQVLAARQQLKVDGFAVIKGIYSAGECVAFHNDFWASLHAISNGRFLKHPPACAADIRAMRFREARDDKPNFRTSNDWLRNEHGILMDGQLAHLPICYALRCNPKIAAIFALLYAEDDEAPESICKRLAKLVVSADRLNYQLPPEWLPTARSGSTTASIARFTGLHFDSHPQFDTKSEGSWLHVDQSREYLGFRCYQGLVQFTDASQDGDASLECIPGSHESFSTLEQILGIKKFEKPKDNWYKFSDADKDRTYFRGGAGQKFISVRAPAGSLILWDSRTIHQGGRIRPSLRQRPIPRFVIYVCMQPGNLSAVEIDKKQKVFAEYKAVAHWPLKTKIFGAPRVYGADKDYDPKPVYDYRRALYTPEQLAAWPVLRHLFGVAWSDAMERAATTPLRTDRIDVEDKMDEEEDEERDSEDIDSAIVDIIA